VWRRLLRPVLVVTVLVFVFVWLLPQFIDYDEVWDALGQLDGWEVAVLFALGLARIPTEALMYRAFLPGLGLRRGSEAYLSSNFAGQLLPPPSASVVQYGYFRAGGYASDASGLAALGSFVFPTIGRFLLPLVALVLLILTGEVTGSVWLVGGLSVVVSGAAGVAAYFFLRRERSARRLGARLQRPLSWTLVRLEREPIEDGAGRAAEIRTRALAILREGWALGSIGVAANLVLTYLILLAALRFVGVTAAELPAAEGRLRDRLLGGRGLSDHRQRSRRCRRRPHRDADRAGHRLRRRTPRSSAPLARLLLRSHAAAWSDHARTIPEGKPRGAASLCINRSGDVKPRPREMTRESQ
jgi:uncharacterized membrane protein YbhN (UPF0104 family)